LAVVGWAGAALAQTDDLARGQALARRNCSVCHAIGPRGASPNPVAPPFRELGKRYPLENLEEALAEGILTGHPAMPEFHFTPNQIKALISYMKSIQNRDHAEATRGSAAG
jgi:mono/diheme cytochrome c family protein